MELFGFIQRLMGHSRNGDQPEKTHWTQTRACEGSGGRLVYKSKLGDVGTCPVCKHTGLRVTKKGTSWPHTAKSTTHTTSED